MPKKIGSPGRVNAKKKRKNPEEESWIKSTGNSGG